MRELKIPKPFLDRYDEILGEQASEFIEFCKKPLRKSIRINTIKADPKIILKQIKEKGWTLKKVPWCNHAYWVDNWGETPIGNTLEHFMGHFYVQEASSMIPPVVLDPQPNETILDVAAAPGSKTTQMAEMMENTGVIIANDPNLGRIRALRFNLDKGGVVNTTVNRKDGAAINRTNITFDRILLDAPCSAEGTIRKDWKVLNHWGEKHIASLSRIQKRLILSATDNLKDGGTLVYSTCTLAPEENEEVISFLLDKKPEFTVVKPNIKGLKTRPGMTVWRKKQYNEQVKNCSRIYPQDNDSEGFFVAKLIKNKKASNEKKE